MAGLFGLFGKKNNDEPKGSFFLSPDESKTYGDIEFMRTSKTVTRTFVKTVGNPDGGEVVSQVSSDRAIKRDAKNAQRVISQTSAPVPVADVVTAPAPAPVATPAPAAAPAATTPAPAPAPAPVAETPVAVAETPAPAPAPAPVAAPAPEPEVDNSMDMFRSMAKKIRR